MVRPTAHRNLNSLRNPSKFNPWTWYDGSRTAVNRRTAQTLTMHDVVFKHPSGKKAEITFNGGKRGVYAWFTSETCSPSVPEQLPTNVVRIRLNPTRGERYFHVDGERVDTAQTVYLLSDGTAWAILPT